jgi:prepilin-type N-terminal cleavage/methylation domain-containing protein
MKRRSAFTLVELLTVVGVSGILFSMTGQLFGDGWRETQRIQRQADAAQVVIIVMERWQHALRDTTPDTWATGEAAFAAGPDRRIRQDGRRLLFVHAAATNSVALPAGMDCAFAVDRGAGRPDIAVLTLTLKWPGQKAEERVRIAACGGRSTP